MSFSRLLISMFHGKRISTGYYSADFFCETFPVIASDKVIKGYWEIGSLITLYNPFTPVAHIYYAMLEMDKPQNHNLYDHVSRET